MRFTMSSEKTKTNDAPAVVFQGTQQQQQISENPKSHSKKYVIAAVSVVIVVLLVLAAVLIGVYFFTQAEQNLVKSITQLAPNIKQETTVDPENNIIDYHVESPGLDARIVADYNRYIEILKFNTTDNCYAIPMNESGTVDLNKIGKPVTPETANITSLYYVPSRTPIPDISFLSQKVKDLCSKNKIYWVYPACNANFGMNSKNRKRRGVCEKTCSLVCGWFSCSNYCVYADITCTVLGWLGGLFG